MAGDAGGDVSVQDVESGRPMSFEQLLPHLILVFNAGERAGMDRAHAVSYNLLLLLLLLLTLPSPFPQPGTPLSELRPSCCCCCCCCCCCSLLNGPSVDDAPFVCRRLPALSTASGFETTSHTVSQPAAH